MIYRLSKSVINLKPLLLIISCLLFVNIYSQETSNIDQLELIPGKIKTYCSEGFEDKGKYLQLLLEDAVQYYEEVLNDTFSFELFVLDRRSWKKFTNITYPIPHYSNDEKRMIMPVNSYYKIQLHNDDSLYGKDHYSFTDFIAIHELGHCIARLQGARSHSKWAGEFFADFIMVAYMHEIIPGFEFGSRPAKVFSFLPLKYKGLEEFGSAGIANEMFYHPKFQELANKVFLKHGLDFMFDYLEIYKQLNKEIKEGKFENINVTEEMIFENSIENILSIEPEIFKEWDRGMRQTFHSWLSLFGLMIIIATIRLTDTSYLIFNKLKLKTNRIHKIIGIPSIRIIQNLKNITTRSLKIRLIRIGLLRIINIILVSALILILVILLWQPLS